MDRRSKSIWLCRPQEMIRRVLVSGLFASGVLALYLVVPGAFQGNSIDSSSASVATASVNFYQCSGDALLRRKSKSRVALRLGCSNPFYGLRIDVTPLQAHNNRLVAGSIKRFWRHLRLRGGGVSDVNECRRLGVSSVTLPGIACVVDRVEANTNLESELMLRRGERCRYGLWLRQFAPGQPNGPGTPVTPPSIEYYTLFRGKPLGCPKRK